MERYEITDDIPVLYLTADSFPDGIPAVHHILHAIVGTQEGRIFFGISYPDQTGEIAYKAGVEKRSEEEVLKWGFETFTIRKGTYNSIMINDYYKDPSVIGEAFGQLLSSPDLDPQGACIEMYQGEKDVLCMVRLK